MRPTRAVFVGDESGTAMVFMISLSGLLAVAFLGTWGLMRGWHQTAQVQRRLDACVGKTAHELRDRLNRIERLNRLIPPARVAAMVATLLPPAKAAATAALYAMAAAQEFDRWAWRYSQARWIVRQGCDGKLDNVFPLPSLPWTRDPPDSVGPMPLRWPSEVKRRFSIQLRAASRASAAIVRADRSQTSQLLEGSHRWESRWSEFSLFAVPTDATILPSGNADKLLSR